MELEKVHSLSHRCCLASRASRSLKYIYIVPLTRHVLLPPATPVLPQCHHLPPPNGPPSLSKYSSRSPSFSMTRPYVRSPRRPITAASYACPPCTARSPYHHSRGSNLSWITCQSTMRPISAHSTSAPPALVSLALPLSHRRPVPRHFAEYSPSPLV